MDLVQSYDMGTNKVRLKPEYVVSINQIKADLKAKSASEAVGFMCKLCLVPVCVEKNGREETVSYLFLSRRLNNGWKLKAIDLNYLLKIDYIKPVYVKDQEKEVI